jgi:hypothetical protein
MSYGFNFSLIFCGELVAHFLGFLFARFLQLGLSFANYKILPAEERFELHTAVVVLVCDVLRECLEMKMKITNIDDFV